MTTPVSVMFPKVGGSNPPPATNLLLQSNVERYLQEVALLRKPGTLREARRICFEALPFLNPTDPRQGVLAFLSHRKAQGIDPRTLENERIRLGAFYRNIGVEKLKIPKFKFVQRKPEVYTQAELNAIFTHANGRDLWLFKTLLQAGLRMQEAMYLEYGNLRDEGIQVAPHGDWVPKDYEERIVKVPRSLIDALRALPRIADKPLVFPTQWGTVNFHMLRALKRTAKRAGLGDERCFLHKFRANFCTTLLRGGMNIREVMAQMGHSNIKSTMRYMALLDGETVQEQIEAIWA